MKMKKIPFVVILISVCFVMSTAFGLNGFYRMSPLSGSSRYIEKTSQTNWSDAKAYNQNNSQGGSIWKITSLGNGYHRIEMGGKALTASGSSQWSDVQTVDYSGWSSQQWTITGVGSGRYKIVCMNGKALTLSGTSNGQIAKVATYSSWSSQKWNLNSITDSAITGGNWNWIHYKINRNWSLPNVVSNTLVIDCNFHDFNYRAISLENVNNVKILRTTIQNITADFPLFVLNSSSITIDDCYLNNHKRPSAAHSAFLRVGGGNNVIVRNSDIIGSDGNGIFNENCSNLTIKNNVITTTGRFPFSVSAPFHGIYSRSPDALIEGNTISNCRDGSGVSMRSTGRILSNIISDCIDAGIAYWPNATPGSSGKLDIMYNEVTQSTRYQSQTWSSALCIGIYDSGSGAPSQNYFDNFYIKQNDCLVQSSSSSNDALVSTSFSTNHPHGYGNVDVMNNILEDRRSSENFLDGENGMDQVSGNTLL